MWLSILIFGLSLFSAIWLSLGLTYIDSSIGFYELHTINPTDLAVILTSIAGPILIAVLIMILAHNHNYLKNLFANQQAFIKLLQTKMEFSQSIEQEKLDIMRFNKIEKITDHLSLQISEMIIATNVINTEETKTLWNYWNNGNKNAFITYAIDETKGASIIARLEAKTIQDADFSDEIIDMCHTYEDIYDVLAHSYDEIFIRQFVSSPIARFIQILASFKSTKEKLFNEGEDYNFTESYEVKDTVDTAEPLKSSEIKKNNTNEDEEDIIFISEDEDENILENFDWHKDRTQLINKYQKFASDIKTNIDKGALNEK